ncbi:unnamed protein product [Ranitomeya imitator]|uniref:Uncharacterized protein n=1 Tax=Ranitomeya imitator TaxID=111125 RepID=A0ABN9LR28_9NEOB|nr:unnamed protein product [Ranitomeya imitator]
MAPLVTEAALAATHSQVVFSWDGRILAPSWFRPSVSLLPLRSRSLLSPNCSARNHCLLYHSTRSTSLLYPHGLLLYHLDPHTHDRPLKCNLRRHPGFEVS